MRNWFDAILIWLGLRHRSYWFLSFDGKTELSMDGIRCRRCQNCFWVEDAGIEMPSYCCYCGTCFTKVNVVDNGTFEDEKNSSN